MSAEDQRARSGEGPRGEEAGLTGRAGYLAFVRANHPDLGGDPEVFKAGLARFARARPGQDTGRQRDHRPGDRYDAPIEVVVRPRGPGLIRYLVRRWRQRRTRPPRVE